jgi:tRNA threonylcarbamoyladenosine biosynthesis protein TsaB
MIVLGLDTCLSSCSVAVLEGERVLAAACEVMARGHQERLAPMAQAVMADAGLAFDRLDRIAVTVGPGSFTAIDARRGQLYLQAFEDGRALMAPDALSAEVAAARLAELSRGRPFTLVGSGSALLAGFAPDASVIAAEGADARRVARLAVARPPGPLKPLYLRAPDAKLPA